jgi:hypothetical protein
MEKLEDLKELRERAKAATKKVEAKTAAADEARERRELEGEIKLAELDDTLGVRGRDYEAVFSAKTGDMVVVKAPLEVHWQKVSAKAFDDTLSLKDSLELIASCLAFPDMSAFGKICEVTPGIIGDASAAITKLAGVRDAKVGKK